ncbi:hypothetical protein L208DRAFT_822803 [Tricholoma matsutake]|nr:hypothetical protein L208DRAFT_822803 [Tricholoma matsutake 945]
MPTNTVYSVSTLSPHVHNSLSNTSTKENAQSASNGVLCNICYERLDQGNSSSSNTLIQHQKSNKCRLKFADRILAERTQRPLPLPTLCEGFSYHWSLGTPCRTYPLPLHDPSCHTKPGFTLLSIEPSSSIIHPCPHQERHGSWEQRSDHTKFREKITISPEEERLGMPNDLVGRSVMRHLNYDAARMDRLPTIHDLHCLLMFIIILTSSHKLMFFIE